jgi:hypothetical protein
MSETVKAPTKTAISKLRHAELKAAILAYWRHRNGDIEMPWGREAGRALGIWQGAHEDITLPEFQKLLQSRNRSAIDHSEPPAKWIGALSFYRNGPLDRFYEPLGDIRSAAVPFG